MADILNDYFGSVFTNEELTTILTDYVTEGTTLLLNYLTTADNVAQLIPYLTKSVASTTYQPIGSYLTIANATSTYQTIANMSNYLTTSAAESTYESITDFNNTITEIANEISSTYLKQSVSETVYQTKIGMSSYYTQTQTQALSNLTNYYTKTQAAALASPTFTGTVSTDNHNRWWYIRKSKFETCVHDQRRHPGLL